MNNEKVCCTKNCTNNKNCYCTLTQEQRNKLTNCVLSDNYDYMAKYNHSISYWAEMHGED